MENVAFEVLSLNDSAKGVSTSHLPHENVTSSICFLCGRGQLSTSLLRLSIQYLHPI